MTVTCVKSGGAPAGGQLLGSERPAEQRIHLVMHKLSTHGTAAVRAYCQANRIRMVFMATNASWMNRIECHFAPLKHFAIANSDYANHEQDMGRCAGVQLVAQRERQGHHNSQKAEVNTSSFKAHQRVARVQQALPGRLMNTEMG